MKRFKRFSVFLLSLAFLFGCSKGDKVPNNESKTPVKGETTSNKGNTKAPQGITVNKISFQEVGMDSLPPNMNNSINNFKANRGYLVYDYNGYYYIAVFSGKKNTGGYSIKVLSIEDNEGKTNIVVEEKNPPKGAIVTQVITYPYTVVKATGITPNITVTTTTGETLEKIMKEGELY